MVRLCHSILRIVVAGPALPNEPPSQTDIPDDRSALVPDPPENVGVALLVVTEPDKWQPNDDPVGKISARSTLPCHPPRQFGPCVAREAPAGEDRAEDASTVANPGHTRGAPDQPRVGPRNPATPLRRSTW